MSDNFTSDGIAKPKLKRDWIGLQVRLIRDIQNGSDIFGAGTIMKVKNNYGGLRLEQVSVCPHCKCGERRWITKVPECDVEITGSAK